MSFVLILMLICFADCPVGCPGPDTPPPNEDGLRWYDYSWYVPSPPPCNFYDYELILRDCLCGPDVLPAPGCEARFDYNEDGYVDMRDIAIFHDEADEVYEYYES